MLHAIGVLNSCGGILKRRKRRSSSGSPCTVSPGRLPKGCWKGAPQGMQRLQRTKSREKSRGLKDTVGACMRRGATGSASFNKAAGPSPQCLELSYRYQNYLATLPREQHIN